MNVSRPRTRIAALFLLVAVCLSACSGIPKSTKEELTAVASVGGYEVSYEQMRYFVLNLMRDEAAGDETYWTQERAAEEAPALYAEALDKMKPSYAILSLCAEYGIDPENGAITDLADVQVKSFIDSFESTADYVASLRGNYLTDHLYRFLVTVGVCEEELYYAMLSAGDIASDDDVIEPIVRSDAFVRVKQILISSENGRSDEEMRARAEQARERAAAGEDFDALVREYGEDLYMFNNTDGYYICRGVWYTEFEDAAFSLAIGEVSGVVRSDAGYSVLLRCPKEEKYLRAHMEDLCGDWRDAQFSLKIEARAAGLQAECLDALAAYTPLTMTMP